MEIQTLKVFVSEQELQALARQYQQELAPDAPVKNLTVRILPDGVHVSGEFTMMVTMAFETVWKPVVMDGRVAIYLVGLSAAGFPVGAMFRPLVMAGVKDAIKEIKEPSVQVIEEAIVVDVQGFVREQKLPVAVSFEMRTVDCVEGAVVAEAGSPKPPSKPAG